jgi:hypothetical protein
MEFLHKFGFKVHFERVHGWALNETQAKERFDRVKLSLENKNNSYIIPIVGYSWTL